MGENKGNLEGNPSILKEVDRIQYSVDGEWWSLVSTNLDSLFSRR